MKAAAGAGLILILTLVGGVASAATAVVRDGTVGADVSLQPMADSFGVLEIDESMGSRPGGGVNLLHSFSVFSVDAGNTALFTADPGLTTLRVISRVTGSEASLIFGTVASSIPGADLFLLNPRGIVFGADASLDVQGSFYASTAQSISMIDGDTDGALTFTNDVRLAFAEPQAFGFLGAPASLVVQGARLDAPDGATLSLSGADVELQPGARLRGAQRINIAAAGTEASLPIALDQWTPGAGQGGLVAMDGATLDVRGERKGTIYLGGRDVSLVDSTLRGDLAGGPSANPSVAIGIVGSDSVELRATTVEVTADGSRRTGSIEIYGGDISFAEGSEVTTGPCQNCDGGAGGAIVVSAAGDLDLVEPGEDRGTLLSTSTGSARNAGDVTLMAAGELYVETGTINSFTLADGRAGSILLDAHVIEVVDGALIVSTSGPADAGGGGAASGGGGGSGGGGSGGGSGGGGSGGGS
ncbi:MAG: filamentous hemagglutinin N-terminal domain-containing protein, partial [Gammaproteobacteria bacterium]|nr:filamentous hemagglutinin N-terminal domain-containing protein [Gammaproteobacteria bacterium]